MGAFADEMKALASEMLYEDEFGKGLATFTRKVNSGVAPNTLALASVGTPTTFQALVAPLDFSLFEINQGTVLEGEKKLYVEVNSAGDVPNIDDTVSLDSKNFKIMKVIPYETQNTVCAYLCMIAL